MCTICVCSYNAVFSCSEQLSVCVGGSMYTILKQNLILKVQIHPKSEHMGSPTFIIFDYSEVTFLSIMCSQTYDKLHKWLLQKSR